jgi:hypothetical protein
MKRESTIALRIVGLTAASVGSINFRFRLGFFNSSDLDFGQNGTILRDVSLIGSEALHPQLGNKSLCRSNFAEFHPFGIGSQKCPAFAERRHVPAGPHASEIIRRFSSNSALSISPRAKRSFRISIAVEEVSRLFSRGSASLPSEARRSPQHQHHMIAISASISTACQFRDS